MLKRFSVRRRRSTLTFNVLSLDGTTLSFDLESRSTGADVLERALEASGVQGEREFFGLVQPAADSQLRWLSLRKPLKKQLTGRSPYSVNMRVYMYPRSHQSINQTCMRHMLYLQIKQDMFSGRLKCPTSELLHRVAGLALQSEIGDFTAQRCGLTYVSDFELIPVLTRTTEESISHLHRLNRGRSSEECEIELLDLVQDLPTYGAISYDVQDSSRQTVSICVSPIGVKVQQRTTERASFEWDSIEKIMTRGRVVTFHISATHTLAPYQVQYLCQNSVMANNIARHCQYLLEYYCVPVVVAEQSKSRLKRWFSSRRSLRRRPSPMTRHFKDSSGNTQVANGRRASFGGEQPSSTLTTVNANSRMSLRVMSRNDSKLVVYGSGGLASSVSDSAQTTPKHHTFKLESHQVDPPDSMTDYCSSGTTPPHRGSVTDVEHKSISSLLQSDAHSNQATPPVGLTRILVTQTSSIERNWRENSQLYEVDSPTKSMVMLRREDEMLQNSLTRPKRFNDYQPPPKKEWYHDDVSSPQDTRAFYEVEVDHAYRASSTTGVETPARSSRHGYHRHDSVNDVQNYRHSSSTENFDRERSTNHMRRSLHSQSVDQIGRENRHSSPSKHHHHHRSHRHHHHQHHQHHNDYQSHYRHSHERNGNISSSPLHNTRSSKSSSDLAVKRKKSSSLPRDTPPDFQEEEREDPEVQSMSHYIDRHHPARPANRGHYRLSLPDSSYYDNGNRISRQTNARRSRKGLTNTGLASSGSLSQPNDFGLGLSSRLGSIASLEYQASFAELSQSDMTSVIDPHTRSFIFEGSQSNSQGTVL